ncbi:MAG: A/G-specific adenine glycosylase [Bacteroidetes bacterium]|nr:A/G-specific adenine glycosylase [Bacteroidota bacterium]
MDLNKSHKAYFTKRLIGWHHNENDRDLPWKQEKDPYKIWLSEIILQQTRAQQGLPYYLNFTKAYPNIKKLAAANDEEVFRIWQGLGYYNRCKNMLATARYITNELKGKFPNTYEEILTLKGVGPYTAAAISSFAFGLPHAVVDGNAYRVLSRYFGIETPIDSNEGKQLFQSLANELLYKDDSAGYNQAIMDIGATVCTPKNPICTTCPLIDRCVAFKQNLIDILPVKTKKLVVRTRYFNYIFFQHNEKIWIHKRTGKDIWQNLHEPFLIETIIKTDVATLIKTDEWSHLKTKAKPILIDSSTQKLTHRIIDTNFFSIDIKEPNINLPGDGNWVKKQDLKKLAFPKTIVSFLEKNFYF